MIYSWYDFSQTKTFPFTFTVGTPVKFCFDKALVPAAKAAGNRPFKRRRPLWDVDGGTSEGKKKRRLLRFLITSPLSRPFSLPATNICDRGRSKLAAWTKGRSLDKSLLRKAAIMNRVKRNIEAFEATVARREDELSRRVLGFQQMMPAQRPKCYNAPLPRLPITGSPLVGVSNYDALDDEDMEDCGDSDGDPEVYSDWKKIEPSRAVDEDEYEYDYLDELDGIPHELVELPKERPPPPPDERMLEMMKEKEKQKELVSCILSHSAGFVTATSSTFLGRPVGKNVSGME